MNSSEDLLLDIARFLRDHDVTETTFGMSATGSPNFVSNLRRASEGRAQGPTLATVDKVRIFMKVQEERRKRVKG